VNRLVRCPGVFRLVQPASLLFGLAFLSFNAEGCADDTIPGSRIAATRVLGARVETAADPNQTQPAPGEIAQVTWLVTGPRAPRPLAWAFQAWACDDTLDADHCAQSETPLNVVGFGSSDGLTAPQLNVTAPDASAVTSKALTHLLIRGVICAGGRVASVDAAPWARCSTSVTDGGARVDETDVQMTVALRQDAGNRPPSLTDNPITWGGASWTSGIGESPTAGGDGECAAAPGALIVPIDDKDHDIVVASDAEDRETYVPAAQDAATIPAAVREALQLSAFATAGSFDSQFEGIASTETNPAPSFALKWTPPDTKSDPIPATGRLVRFIFVLRDLRGGIDWSTRTLCLVPKP